MTLRAGGSCYRSFLRCYVRVPLAVTVGEQFAFTTETKTDRSKRVSAAKRKRKVAKCKVAAAAEEEPAEKEAVAAAAATVAQRKAEEQASSRYVGVSWAKKARRWAAAINHEGRSQHLGLFVEEAAAARAYDEAARRLRGDEAHGGVYGGGTWRLNFPTAAEAAAAPNEEEPADEQVVATAEATAAQRRAAGQASSRCVGVRWVKRDRRWAAAINHEGRSQYLGLFTQEEAAARAYDDASRRLRGDEAHGGRSNSGGKAWRLNFPTEAEKQRNGE
eukprot:COSAG04_NODE_153_length_22436_cov_37.366029_1_plen_275_part_00